MKIFAYLIYQLYFNSRLVQCFKLLGIFSQKTINNCFQLFISYSLENKQHIFNQSANNEVVTYCILHITYCLDERNMNMKFTNSIRNASIRKVVKTILPCLQFICSTESLKFPIFLKMKPEEPENYQHY